MNFLYPQFLFGLFALAIPVIIHLFNFRRTKKVYFSNLKFLKKVKEASSSKLKLKHYLILLSRLLFIFLLVCAFAQPFIPSTNEGFTSKKVIIYLDNSFSMSNNADENLTAFDLSLSHIDKLIKLYPSSTQYRLITNDFKATSNNFKSGDEISDLLTEESLSGVRRTGEEILNRMDLEDEIESLDIFWFSDFQISTLGNKSLLIDSLFDVNIVPLSFTSIDNVYFDSLYLDNPFTIGDQSVKMNIIITNRGKEVKNDLNIKVFVNEKQATTALIDIEPNDKYEMSFDLTFDPNSVSKGKISIEEYPVTFDNDLYFVINKQKQINILEIYQNREEKYIQNVYGNQKLFDFNSYSVGNLDYNLLNAADLVIVNGLSDIEPSFAAALNKRFEAGGHILIIPSGTPNMADYQQLNRLQNISLTDNQLQSPLANPDLSNPFFANIFEESRLDFAMPKVTPVINLPRDRNALLKLQNGDAFLSELNKGFYVMSSPLISDFSGLPNHALFVPIMYRMAANSTGGLGRLFYFVDEDFITFKNDSIVADNVFKLANEKSELIPLQRIKGDEVLMEIPKYSLEAGFYDLVFANKKITTLAFNNSPKESDLRQLQESEFGKFFKGNVEVITAVDDIDFGKAIKNKYIGQPLWKYAILLALLFLLIEVLLIRFFP
jgi:hypothetical protein